MVAKPPGPHDRALVLDGDPFPELARRGIAIRPSPAALPLAVREPLAMRHLLRDAVLAGADVLTAPTGELHRRALARIGASRRTREWIAAALSVTHDAIDEADDAGRSPRGAAPALPLRLAALVLPLEGAHRPDFAPDASTADAEHRAHVGMLADAGAEAIRIEQMGTIAESEAATRAAVDTGLVTWSGIAVASDGRTLVSGEPVEAWAESIGALRPAALLVSAPTIGSAVAALRLLAARTSLTLGAAVPFADEGVRTAAADRRAGGEGARAGLARAADRGGSGDGLGREADVTDERRGAGTDHGADAAGEAEPAPGWMPGAAETERLLEVDARLLWPDRDGAPDRVRTVREAVDRIAAARAAAQREAIERQAAWVEQAAGRSSPGRALWLGERPPSPALPVRFTWDVAPAADMRLLPDERYALAIVPSAGLHPSDGAWIVGALRPGGWLLFEGPPDAVADDSRIEGLEPAERLAHDVESWIARRRP